MPSYLARYRNGEHELVWQELLALGADVRQPGVFEDAVAVARETMRRVRRNVETLHQRLLEREYLFEWPSVAFAPADGDALTLLDEVESTIGGPLPLSLRAYYEEIGRIDFCQHWSQCSRDSESPWRGFGRANPLYVYPLRELVEQTRSGIKNEEMRFRVFLDFVERHRNRPSQGAIESADAEADWMFCIAPNEDHKAGYSGGDNYHVRLPNAAADFTIEGMYKMEETFVTHLRLSLQGGGFRWYAECANSEPNPRFARQDALVSFLVEGLLPL